MLTAIRSEYQLLRRSYAARWLLRICLAAGVVSVVWPTAVAGRDVTLAGYGVLSGAAAGLAVNCAGGPILVLVGLGRELDSDIRSARLLGGLPPGASVLAALGAVAAAVVVSTAAAAAAGLVTGISDWTRRQTWGPTGAVTRPSSALLLALLAAALVASVVTWLTTLATRAGHRTAGLLGIIAASWLLILYLVPPVAARNWAVLHPLGGLWALAYGGRSVTVRLDVPSWVAIGSVTAWTLVLGLAALRARPWLGSEL